MTDEDIERIKHENDYLIIKFFGIENLFSQENQDER